MRLDGGPALVAVGVGTVDHHAGATVVQAAGVEVEAVDVHPVIGAGALEHPAADVGNDLRGNHWRAAYRVDGIGPGLHCLKQRVAAD